MGLLIVAIIVVVIVVRATTPDERARALQKLGGLVARLRNRPVRGLRQYEAFRDALRQRSRRVVVMPLLAALNVTIAVLALSSGGLADSETLLRWGANFGPRTTNGEWWRLMSSIFVHTSVLSLVVSTAALVQVGGILERLVGRLTFLAIYLAAGLFASLMTLSQAPAAMNAGASGAVAGLYGLLVAAWLWSAIQRSSLTIPLVVMKRLAPAAGVFGLFNAINGSVAGLAELAALALGFASGLVLLRAIPERTPPDRLATAALATTAVIVAAFAVPLRGLADVKPELQLLVGLEQHTSELYRKAVVQFRQGRASAGFVAQLIDETILPDLDAAGDRLRALHKVPPEHLPLVAEAGEYLRLRSESWRLRAATLRETTRGRADRVELASDARVRAEAEYRTSLTMRGRADATERAALEVLHRISPAS